MIQGVFFMHKLERSVLLPVLLLLIPAVVHASSDYCRAEPYRSFMPDDDLFGACYVWDGSAARRWVAYAGEWGPRPSATQTARLDDTRQAIDRTLELYADLVRSLPDPVIVFVTDRPYGSAALDSLYAFNAREREDLHGVCPIGVTAAGYALDRARYLQTLAHELGHCMIDDYTGKFSSSKGEDFWHSSWYEGIAEYLSNQAYVSTDAEDEYVSRYSSRDEILNVDYNNVVFFQYYGNHRGGARGVLELADRFSDHPDPVNLLPVLTAEEEIEDFWHDFAKSVVDRSVADQAGSARDGVLPPSDVAELAPAMTLSPESGSGALTADADIDTFTFFLQEVTLLDQGVYTLEPPTTTSGDLRASVRDGGVWTALDSELEIAVCEEEQHQISVLLSVTSDEYITPEPRLAYSAEPNPACGRCIDTGRRDPCAVGAWELDSDALESYLQRNVFSRLRSSDPRVPEREFRSRMWMRADGTARAISTMDLVVEQPGPLGTTSLRTESATDVASTWSTGEDRFYNCRENEERRLTQTFDASLSDPSGEAMVGHFVRTYRNGELAETTGRYTLTPARDADADEIASTRERQNELNSMLRSGGAPPDMAPPAPTDGVRDPWTDLTPASYTCSEDRLVIEAVPGGTVAVEDRGTFQFDALRFVYRRIDEPEPPAATGVSSRP